MNFIPIKIFFTSYFAKIFYRVILIFFVLDVIFSNFIISSLIRGDCFLYTKYPANERSYYTYELEKNCRAYETQRTVKTYNVFTDENGYRVPAKRKIKNNKIVFLGDSYPYGFGVEYEDSIAGILEKKIDYEIINLGVPGYSPVILRFKLEKLIKSGVKPEKIFYFMDYTDVNDESNRWTKINNIKHPVILDEKIHEEIKHASKVKGHFKITRLLIYKVNKLVRNIRKDFNKKKFEEGDKIIGSTPSGSFTYTHIKDLDKEFWPQNSFEDGINNIMKNVKLISSMAKEINSSFYIVIYPWPETLEYGEKYFSWQDFASALCQFSKCTKLINSFPQFYNIKREFLHWKKEYYNLQDIHLNSRGYSLLADVIYNDIFN